MKRPAAASVLLAVSLCFGQPQPPKVKVKMTRIPGPVDAQWAALADLSTTPPSVRPYVRYVWVRDGSVSGLRGVSLIVNQTVVDGPEPVRPTPIQNGKLLLARLDFLKLVDDERLRERLLRVWEELQYDPAFNLLLTKDVLRNAARGRPSGGGYGTVAGWSWRGGRWRWEAVRRKFSYREFNDVVVVAVPAGDVKIRRQLEQLTNSYAPVVSSPYFVRRATTSVQDKGVYATVYGGLYYDLANVPKASAQQRKRGISDEDLLFEQLGVGVAGRVRAQQVYDRLKSDRRAAVFRSKVTGRARRADFLPTLAGTVDSSERVVIVTHDVRRQDIDIGSSALANLLDFKDFAREVIFTRPNGTHGYALYNGAGARQDSVPEDVAADHEIPAPHIRVLEPSVGCMGCHEAEGSDGWKRMDNDVKRLARVGGLDVFGDTTNRDNLLVDDLKRLIGLYRWDPEKALMKGRDAYAAAVLKSTGPWPEAAKLGQTNVVHLAARRVVGEGRGYWYDLVGAREALLELGVRVEPPEAALSVLRAVLKPDKRAAVPVPELGVLVVPEDFRVGALLDGLSVNRYEWDLVYAFAAERSAPAIAKLFSKN